MAFDWLGTTQTGAAEQPERSAERRWLHGHQGTITWTRPKLQAFEKTYEGALEVNAEAFRFDGYEFLTQYAGFLIGYLDKVLI